MDHFIIYKYIYIYISKAFKNNCVVHLKCTNSLIIIMFDLEVCNKTVQIILRRHSTCVWLVEVVTHNVLYIK